jgi:hypothetical protein
MTPRDASRDQRRHTFWIDDRVIDAFAPVMRRYPCGTAALAVYAALARRADRDGESWPRLCTLAEQAATSERTAQRAIQLLEALGLLEVTTCFEEGSRRQTSNLYTLLPPPAAPPVLDPEPARWPTPVRRTLLVRPGRRAQAVADARQGRPLGAVPGTGTPRHSDTPPPAMMAPRRRQPGAPSAASVTPQEGEHRPKDVSVKDESLTRNDTFRSFTIAEIGLSSGQVWAAALGELARGGAVSPTDLEAWLRPAALVGREGDALLLGTPNTVARDRIAARLLPAVRAALAQIVGTPLPVRVVVAGQQGGNVTRLDRHAASPEPGFTGPPPGQRAAS